MENNKIVIKEDNYSGWLNNMGIQRLQHDVGDTNRDVKQSEAEIRSDIKDVRFDVAKSECATVAATKDAECRIANKLGDVECNITKEVLSSRHLLSEKILEQGFENRLLQKDTVIAFNDKFQHLSERFGDKLESKFERVERDIENFRREQVECCCEIKGALSLLTGGVLPAHK